MQEFKRATFHKESTEESDVQGTFVFEPLERGFGTTIGNAVCRVLMMNLPGSGVVGFTIEGADPNATTVAGILEDVTGILLNVKALKLTSDSDQLETLTISKEGPAIVTAADLICPEEVDITDPDQPICTLEKGASLNMNLYVANGIGFKSASENREAYSLPEEAIAIDTPSLQSVHHNCAADAARNPSGKLHAGQPVFIRFYRNLGKHCACPSRNSFPFYGYV